MTSSKAEEAARIHVLINEEHISMLRFFLHTKIIIYTKK